MTQHEQAKTDVERAVAFGLLTAVGGYAFIQSFEYGWFNEGNRVGPGLVPAVTGGLVALISGALLVVTLLHREPTGSDGLAQVATATTGEETDDSDEQDDDVDIFGRTSAQRVRQLWMVAAGLLVALYLVGFVGLLPALGLFCLFASVVVERRPWITSLVITLISVAAAYGVFVVFLDVPLPTGYLEFGG